MRFRAQIKNTTVFSKLTASLSSLDKECWMRLEQEVVRFTIIPDSGTQVWSQIPVETIFDEETYSLEANGDGINLEVNVGILNRALRSTVGASSAQLRLTKKDQTPFLVLTIRTNEWADGNVPLAANNPVQPPSAAAGERPVDQRTRERETWITQEIPIKILHSESVDDLHEPHCPDPDVHIILPGLAQLKNISDRFTKIAMSEAKGSQMGMLGADAPSTATTTISSSAMPKLELSANMHGGLRLSISTDELKIASAWSGLVNPPLDPAHISTDDYSQLPSERMRGWAKMMRRGGRKCVLMQGIGAEY
ncbi:Hus1-like protein [Penicillium verhagenii]|nr:Hus1-like protein [Penicillium verhagenii]